MPPKQFFTVRGFMKSGTNWVGSLLSSHADISCVGEFHWEYLIEAFQGNLANPGLIFQQQDSMDSKAKSCFDDMIRRVISEAAEPSALAVGDRTPTTLEPFILPDAKHITVIRDGRDVLVSRAFHLFNNPGVTGLFDRQPALAETLQLFQQDQWFFQQNPNRLLECEELVRTSVIWWRDHIRKDQTTIEQYPEVDVLTLRYEEIHHDVVGQRRRMFTFLGMDPKRCGDIQGVLKPGFDKEKPSEFLRKGKVGDWKNYFTDQTKQWFNEIAGDLLIELGYVDSPDW